MPSVCLMMRCGSTDFTWQQAQLRLSWSGLGLCCVSYHSPAAYLASAVSSGLSYEVCRYFHHSIDLHSNHVDPPDSLTPDSVGNSCSILTQKFLSNKIEDCLFRKLFDNSIPIDRACLIIHFITPCLSLAISYSIP